MKYINRVRCTIPASDAGITHDGDAGTYFLVLSASFEDVRESMVRAHLMAYLMCDIIDVEIISHRDSISRRSDSPPFLSVYTNATNTPGVSATAGSAKHVADIIIGLANIGS